MEKKYDVVKFVDNEFELELRTDKENDTVWLSQDEMASLFDVDRTRILRHIRNIYDEGELDKKTSVHFLHISDNNPKNRPPELYNLDVIISVGYRVKSKRGIIFRKWANNVLKDYLM